MPSEQEIQAYLTGLNRLQQSWTDSAVSEQAKAKGIANYVKWFDEHEIAIHQNPATQEWKLGEAPQPKKRITRPVGRRPKIVQEGP